jgi:hypothetical protein
LPWNVWLVIRVCSPTSTPTHPNLVYEICMVCKSCLDQFLGTC